MAVKNSKGNLIDYLAQNQLAKVKFTSKSLGPAHKPTFETRIIYEGEELAKAQASTKRQAEHKVAEIAIKAIQQLEANNSEESSEDINNKFAGPWPIFPKLLIKCLEIANEHQNKKANNRLEQIQTNSLKLYKGLLENLGEVVEEE